MLGLGDLLDSHSDRSRSEKPGTTPSGDSLPRVSGRFLLIGLVDAVISFLRVEGLLNDVAGEDLGKQLSRSRFRGPYVHMPLIVLGIVIATFRRSIDFIWLALLVAAAELVIVITRFIFSYEQAFMGDLVRFWYAALFLFASAYTLVHRGACAAWISSMPSFSERGLKARYTNFDRLAWCSVSRCAGLILIHAACGARQTSVLITARCSDFEVTQIRLRHVRQIPDGRVPGRSTRMSMLIQFVSYCCWSSAAGLCVRDPGIA